MTGRVQCMKQFSISSTSRVCKSRFKVEKSPKIKKMHFFDSFSSWKHNKSYFSGQYETNLSHTDTTTYTQTKTAVKHINNDLFCTLLVRTGPFLAFCVPFAARTGCGWVSRFSVSKLGVFALLIGMTAVLQSRPIRWPHVLDSSGVEWWFTLELRRRFWCCLWWWRW